MRVVTQAHIGTKPERRGWVCSHIHVTVGARGCCQLPEDLKVRAVTRLPSLLEYFGYVYFFGSFLAGPAHEFLEYQQTCDLTLFDKVGHVAGCSLCAHECPCLYVCAGCLHICAHASCCCPCPYVPLHVGAVLILVRHWGDHRARTASAACRRRCGLPCAAS
jgi:hypothetical protein